MPRRRPPDKNVDFRPRRLRCRTSLTLRYGRHGRRLGRTLAYAGETADMVSVMTSILAIAILAPRIDQLLPENLKHRLLRDQDL